MTRKLGHGVTGLNHPGSSARHIAGKPDRKSVPGQVKLKTVLKEAKEGKGK